MAHASEKKILVVDDEPDVRNFLAACLEDAGFNVDMAVDGLDALEKVEVFNPDLMTLDMVMPGLSGIKVIRKLREKEKWANLPVIVITAHAHDEMGGDQIKEFTALTSGLRPRITMEKPISPVSSGLSICRRMTWISSTRTRFSVPMQRKFPNWKSSWMRCAKRVIP